MVRMNKDRGQSAKEYIDATPLRHEPLSGLGKAAKNRRNTVAVGAIFPCERIEYGHDRFGADLIAPREGTLWIVRPKLHRDIDIFRQCNALLNCEGSLIDDHRERARENAGDTVVNLFAGLSEARKKILDNRLILFGANWIRIFDRRLSLKIIW